jgi:hypothetical protein
MRWERVEVRKAVRIRCVEYGNGEAWCGIAHRGNGRRSQMLNLSTVRDAITVPMPEPVKQQHHPVLSFYPST